MSADMLCTSINDVNEMSGMSAENLVSGRKTSPMCRVGKSATCVEPENQPHASSRKISPMRRVGKPAPCVESENQPDMSGRRRINTITVRTDL
jgi:hypothetical protein